MSECPGGNCRVAGKFLGERKGFFPKNFGESWKKEGEDVGRRLEVRKEWEKVMGDKEKILGVQERVTWDKEVLVGQGEG